MLIKGVAFVLLYQNPMSQGFFTLLVCACARTTDAKSSADAQCQQDLRQTAKMIQCEHTWFMEKRQEETTLSIVKLIAYTPI